MAIRNYFRKRRLKKAGGSYTASDRKILLSRSLKESPEPESPDTAQVLFTEQETTKKLGSVRKGDKKSQHSPSIFII